MAVLLALVSVSAAPVAAQRGRGAQPPQTPRQQAPVDLTGYWVSVVTEDWRWRMVTPKKGDYSSLALTDEGRRVADAWDPAADERAGNACKAYGAAAIMRVPTRLHITWQDDNTLQIDTDAGTQRKLLHFDPTGGIDPPAVSGERSWQGFSRASWEFLGAVPRGGGGGFGGFGGGGGGANDGGANPNPPAPAPRFGTLKVVTDNLKAGYVRKNGVPYDEHTVVTEYFDHHTENNGDIWLTVTTIVEDPKYFNGPYVTSSGFKRELDGAKWRPTPCTVQ